MERWGRKKPVKRDADPISVMEALKTNLPRVYCLFRKYSSVPATQNSDERVFSAVAALTNPKARKIKVETIAQKIICGRAIQRNGFVYDYYSLLYYICDYRCEHLDFM
jgi:hypothetical protein